MISLDLKPVFRAVRAATRLQMPRARKELLLLALLLSCRRSETKPNGPVEDVGAARESSSAALAQKVDHPQLAQVDQKVSSPYDDVDLATVEIGLERTRCWGWCPEYSVTICDGGVVHYTGKEWVLEVGDRTSRISEVAVRELLSRFKQCRFLDMELACTEVIYDSPGMILRLKVGDRGRTFCTNWVPIPELDLSEKESEHTATHKRIDELAKAIDRTVGVEQWIGSAEDRRACFRDLKR